MADSKGIITDSVNRCSDNKYVIVFVVTVKRFSFSNSGLQKFRLYRYLILIDNRFDSFCKVYNGCGKVIVMPDFMNTNPTAPGKPELCEPLTVTLSSQIINNT